MRKYYGDYSVRPVEEKDLKMLLEWRNSERIHSVMLTDHKITWEEHVAWFERNKNNNPSKNLIFEYKGRPVGYIGYTEFDEENKSCSPGAYLGSLEIPIDAGYVLFQTAIDYAFDILGMCILRTEVIEDNKRALQLDKMLGYRVVGNSNVTKRGRAIRVFILEMKNSSVVI